MPKSTVHLDRTKSNPLFENWKLSRGLSVSELHVTLNGHVTVLDHGTDYLNTRAAVLHNHINCQNGRYFVFKTHDGVNTLCEVTGEQQIAIKTVWGRPPFQLLQMASTLNAHLTRTHTCRAITQHLELECKPAD